MAYTKIALFAAVAALASAQTQDEINELNVILNDVKSNLQDYISLASDSSSGFSLSSLPSGVLDIGMALASATDDSYTTLYSEVDFAAVSKMLTMVPWYSSRLEPALKSLEKDATTTSAAASSTEAKTSSVETTTSAAASSTEAKTSSVETTSAAASSTEAKTSSVETTSSAASASVTASSSVETTSSAASASVTASSSAAKSSAVASSASAKASAISQITDGQIQATNTVSQQTENGAAKAFVGMGAGVVAAAAMLL